MDNLLAHPGLAHMEGYVETAAIAVTVPVLLTTTAMTLRGELDPVFIAKFLWYGP